MIPALRKYLKGKRIALVGPSPSTLKRKNGAYIDSFDLVIRIKKSFPVHPKYHAFLGSKTNILCSHLKVVQNNFSDQEFEQLEQSVDFVWVPFPMIDPFNKFDRDFQRHYQSYLKRSKSKQRLTIHHVTETKKYLKEANKLGTTPTTGGAILMDILNYDFKELYITGFTWRKDGYCSFYKSKEEDRKSYERTIKNKPIHNMNKELTYFAPRLLNDPRVSLAKHVKRVLKKHIASCPETTSEPKPKPKAKPTSKSPREKYISLHSTSLGKFWIVNNDEWIGRVIKSGSAWDADKIRLLIRYIRPKSNVLDIGANIGTHAIPYATKAGHVYCFEPQTKIYDLLIRNIKENGCRNITPYQFGLGHQETQTTLSGTVPDGRSKGKKIDFAGKTLINYGGIEVGQGGETIEMKTLDSFEFDNVSLIKMDVEGCEKLVIYGGQETIRRNRPVLLYEMKKDISSSMRKVLNIPSVVDQFKIDQFMRTLGYRHRKRINNDILWIPC